MRDSTQQGFSLVELMIAITLGLILMTGVVQMFLGSKQTYSSQQAVSQVQESGRLAMEFLSRDIRQAAYYGCYASKANGAATVIPASLDLGGLQNDFNVGVMGYKEANNLPHGAGADLGTVSPWAAPKTQILVLRGASAQAYVGSANNTTNEVYGYTTSAVNGSCVGEICNGYAAIVSDCSKARIFKVSTTPGVAANTLTVKHTESWGGGAVKSENYGKLSEIAAFKTVVYFVGQNPSGGPSLYQKVNAEAAVELVQDVEQINFLYGVDGTNYIKAENMAAGDWAKVNAVKVELVVRSNVDNVVENKQPYTFNGVAVAQADVPDYRVRKVFNATIGLRSR